MRVLRQRYEKVEGTKCQQVVADGPVEEAPIGEVLHSDPTLEKLLVLLVSTCR